MDMPGLIDVLHFKLATVLLGSVIRLRKDQGEILFHPRAVLSRLLFHLGVRNQTIGEDHASP
jgi:hypothetical protein